MKNIILIFFFISFINFNSIGQESDLKINFNETDLSPLLTTKIETRLSIELPLPTNDSNNKTIKNKSNRNKTHTIHPPKKALTLAEYKKLTIKRKENENN